MCPTAVTQCTHDVFLTYNHQDKEWVIEQLVPQLEREKLTVLQEDLDYGTSRSEVSELEEHVERTRRTVVVLTPAWQENEWTALERLVRIDDASGRRPRLLPIMLESCQPPKSIALLPYADFTNPASRPEEMERLLRSLIAPLEPTAPAAGTEENAKLVRIALRTLNRIPSELMEFPPVNEAVQAYRSQLERSRQRILLLSNYKKVHEQLHNVQVQCYLLIYREIKRFPKQSIDWEVLAIYKDNLANIIGKLREIADEESFSVPERAWIEELIRDLDSSHAVLDEAIQKKDPPELQKARGLLSRVLSLQPSYISKSLTRLVGEVELAGLKAALENVRKQLSGYPAPDPQALSQVSDGITALGRLDQTLNHAINNHDDWQVLDSYMRPIVDDLERNSLQQLEWFWPDVERQAVKIYGQSSDPWAVELRRGARALDEARRQAAVPGTNPTQATETVAEAFVKYRGLARQQFYEVDDDLLKHCTKVARTLGAI